MRLGPRCHAPVVCAALMTFALAPPLPAAAAGRDAIIDLDRAPRVPTALDSIPHPWPGAAALASAAGAALPIWVMLEGGNDRETRSRLFVGMLGLEVITPAAGYLYAGIPRAATPGVLVRSTGFALVAAAVAGPDISLDHASSDFTWGHLMVAAGTLIVAGGALADVLVVGGAVERHNEDLVRARARAGIGFAPDGAPALVVEARF